MVAISFHGATRTVTGSRFLLTSDRTRLLVDAGLFQGLKELRLKNWQPLPFRPSDVDAVVVTHAHLDHSGALPLLVKQGFKGPIYTTVWTAKLLEIILLDSAKLQMEDAEYAKRKGFSKHKPPLPLYDEDDVWSTLELVKGVDNARINDEAEVTLHRSGHILGSAFAEIAIGGKRCVFTGDLGRPEHAILNPPDHFPSGAVDLLVTESTYGSRPHEKADPAVLIDAITRTARRGGTILIPAFAVDRTELVPLELKRLMEQDLIPQIPIFVDSPMALKSLDLYMAAIEEASGQIRSSISAEAATGNPFDPGTLKEVRSVGESKALNVGHGPRIVIAASGMATGGRVVHHLEQLLPHAMNSILLVGYQSAGTRGRSLQDGAKKVRMHGREVEVNSEVISIGSFSTHADANELLSWMSGADSPPRHTFVVHGEEDSSEQFAYRIHNELGWPVLVPNENETYQI